MNLKFNKTYFIIFLILFILEVLIATFLKDGFIRHTFGDYLVVILMYCFIRSFITAKPIYIATVVLIIAFITEFLQFYKVLHALGLQNNGLAKLILGNTFHLSDLLAYTMGIFSVLIAEHFKQFKLKRN